MDRYEAQQSFWALFGVPALRDAVAIPQEVQQQWWRDYGAYITYEAATAPFDGNALISASIWTRSEHWDIADELADTVETRLKNGGAVVPYDGGIIWITPEAPFARSMDDPNDDKIKRKSLNVTLHFA